VGVRAAANPYLIASCRAECSGRRAAVLVIGNYDMHDCGPRCGRLRKI
jgi:hypothetical protein